MAENNNNNNNKKIEPFQLPRLDWHDEEGRINKTALIQNFNAIESKLNELSKVDPIEIITPDWNTVEIPDTTIDSDDNSIVNLKSFIDIMGLKKFPITIKFNGTTLELLSYYDDDYKLRNIRNQKLTGLGEDDKVWIYLKPATAEVYITDTVSGIDTEVLIGVYSEGMVLHSGGVKICDINILEPLANMSTRTLEISSVKNDGGLIRHSSGDRLYGFTRRHDHTTSFSAVFPDQGAY
ncbi:MAG: hypothetical protein NC218_08340 [Acetobacter sp.]|nr:hypothetical protein [Acetobacter sp.]